MKSRCWVRQHCDGGNATMAATASIFGIPGDVLAAALQADHRVSLPQNSLINQAAPCLAWQAWAKVISRIVARHLRENKLGSNVHRYVKCLSSHEAHGLCSQRRMVFIRGAWR